MPRGATQPHRSLSCQVRPLPIVAIRMPAGRTARTIAAVSPATPRPSWPRTARSISAVSTTNSVETTRTTSDSLKRRSSEMPGMSMFATATPNTVAAISPASGITRLESEATLNASVRSIGVFRNSGTRSRVKLHQTRTPAPAPSAPETARPDSNSIPTETPGRRSRLRRAAHRASARRGSRRSGR